MKRGRNRTIPTSHKSTAEYASTHLCAIPISIPCTPKVEATRTTDINPGSCDICFRNNWISRVRVRVRGRSKGVSIDLFEYVRVEIKLELEIEVAIIIEIIIEKELHYKEIGVNSSRIELDMLVS